MSFPTAKELAVKARLKYWGDSIPVDPVSVANKLGISVLQNDLPSEVSGALLKEQGEDPVIMVHFRDSPNRKRFTIAHELGHYFYRHNDGDSSNDAEYSYVDLRGSLASAGTDIEEMFANAFAAEFLMPESEVKRLSKREKNPAILAGQFGVSGEAMSVRFSTLRIK